MAATTIAAVQLAVVTLASVIVDAVGEAAMLLVASATIKASKLDRNKVLMVRHRVATLQPSHRLSAMLKLRLK